MAESQYVRITEKGSDPEGALAKQYNDALLRQTLLVADLPWMLGPFNPDVAQEVLETFTHAGGQGRVLADAFSSEGAGAPAKAKKPSAAKAKKPSAAKAKKAASPRKAAGAKKKASGARAKKAPSRGKAKGVAKRKR
jgi:hypothetical protein